MSDTTTTTAAKAEIVKVPATTDGKALTMPNLDYLTPAKVRDGKGTVTDANQILADVAAVKRTADKATGAAMWYGALGAHRLITMTDTVTAQTYAEHVGFAKSYVSRLKRIGAFVVDHGVTRGSEAFTFLCSHGSDKGVGEALKSADPKSALSALIEENKAKAIEAGSARTPRPNDGSDATDAADKADAATGTVEPVALVTPADILSALDRLLKGADRETFAVIEDKVTAMLAREVLLRAKGETVEGEAVSA